jgi:hypothetical protein
MIASAAQLRLSRPGFWKTVVLFGGIHFAVMSYGAFVIEFLKGGCQWIIPAYFMALPVMLSILTLRRFWAGTLVFVPYALIGFFMVYALDYTTYHTMTSIWGAVAWSLGGLFTGLAGDLAFRFLPHSLPEVWRAVLVGAIIGLGTYLTPLITMTFFYIPQPPESHYHQFTTGIVYSLSWLVVNGGFAGYTTHLMIQGRFRCTP